MTVYDDCYKHFQEDIIEMFDNDDEVDFIVSELYNSEYNFNNADKTSGQRCFDEGVIEHTVRRIIKNDYTN